MNALIQTAALMSMCAHEAINQRRKYTFEPYWHHPRAVAELLDQALPRDHPARDSMIAAAWLHDVLEDTSVTVALLKQAMPTRVVDLVLELTDVATPADGNRKARMALNRNHLALASPDAQTIKYADLIDNTKSIVTHDPGFARVYLEEKEELLKVMDRGSPFLRDLAFMILEKGKKALTNGTHASVFGAVPV